jgi:hypothetical protein
LNFVSERGDARRLAVVFATITLALVALLAFAARGHADTIYWDNYKGTPESIGFAGLDGGGGGALNLTGSDVGSPEGMTFDPVTSRLYIASSSGGPENKGAIAWVDINGSGGGILSTPGVEVRSPYGVDIDPNTRTIYWANGEAGGDQGSIGFAKLDGSGGGLLNTTGVTVDSPYKVAVNTANGKLYFGNESGNAIAYANLDGSGGGGTLDISGAPAPKSLYAVAVDAAAGRVYWLDSSEGAEHLSYASVNGGGGGEVSLAGSAMNAGYGLAIDKAIGRIYWANYSNDEDKAGAIGFANLAGGGGGIDIQTAPVDGPQDPIVLKAPVPTGTPTITRNPKVRSELTCSTGSWVADSAGLFVYQAPRSFAYQWSSSGTAIAGATAATLNATAPGQYACTVTATNHTGSATQSSGVVTAKASKVKLSTKKKAKADPGDLVTFQVKIVNQGDVQSKAARICVKLPKAAKDDLRKPKCKKLRPLTGAAKRTTKFRVKVKPGADEGADKLTFQVKGTSGKAAKSKIIVR